MTDDALVELYNDLTAARMAHENIAVRNTVGLTPDEQVDLDVQYRKATNAMWAAHAAYVKALDRSAKQ